MSSIVRSKKIRCPKCGDCHSLLTECKPTHGKTCIRRRRVCASCGHRYTTFETVAKIVRNGKTYGGNYGIYIGRVRPHILIKKTDFAALQTLYPLYQKQWRYLFSRMLIEHKANPIGRPMTWLAHKAKEMHEA